VTGSPDLGVQLTAARRLASSRYRMVEPTSFKSVRLQGRFMGWTFTVGDYPDGRFGFVAVTGVIGPDLYDLRLHARLALYKYDSEAQR
jgi:hypothetical protein